MSQLPTLRVARLWSDVIEGAPVLDAELGRVDAVTPADRILTFLGGGTLVVRAAGRSEDWLAPDRPLVVPIGFRTDGSWLWSEELAFYLREHGVVPEPAFVTHMVRHGFAARPASDAEVRAAEALLRGGEK